VRPAEDHFVLLLVVRRLLGLAVSLVLVTAVCDHLGPALAARSMTGVMQQIDAAQHGDTARAQAIGDDLVAQWSGLEKQVTDLLHQAEAQLDKLAPSR
jgi:hypothetical protein